MGRHKGSKNKPKIEEVRPPEIKRGRGRPKGVKNTILTINAPIISNAKDIKRQIRELKKLKLALHAGDTQRIELHRRIKDLKRQLSECKETNKEKEDIIAKIIALKPSYIQVLEIDYNKFSLIDLTKHLAKIQSKRRS